MSVFFQPHIEAAYRQMQEEERELEMMIWQEETGLPKPPPKQTEEAGKDG